VVARAVLDRALETALGTSPYGDIRLAPGHGSQFL